MKKIKPTAIQVGIDNKNKRDLYEKNNCIKKTNQLSSYAHFQDKVQQLLSNEV